MLMVQLTLCSCAVYPPTENRPASWATPVEAEGVPNMYKVSDVLYRGAQPTEAGMREIKKLGVNTVINLRSFHSDRDEIGNTDLKMEHIFMKSWHPEREDVVAFMRLVSEPTNAPVFVHCHYGADRTGMMCAIYRIVVQGWSKREAIREMRDGGFGFHEIWSNLPDWIDELDVESLKMELGSKYSTEPADGLYSPDDGRKSQR
jgi:protein tyrosine phosphatase (PTP) superfamily phosphohydrolase (DUF442 family)